MATIVAPTSLQRNRHGSHRHHPHNRRPPTRSKFMTPAPLLLPILLLLVVLQRTIRCDALQADCPRVCECKWKSGKESVLCLNANLTTLPPALDAGTQVLDLTGNEIATIPPDAFSRANLLNLQKLFLAKCRLKSIDRFAFRKLINLVELDLSYNVLTMIPTHAFDSTPELRELKVTGNPIQRIMNDAFFNVPQLVRLELTDCRLVTIEEKAFAGLEMSLEWLKIDGNRIMDISSNTLTSLHNLHGLELAGNPWNCTCSLRPLRQWMLRENIPYGIPPVCQAPVRLAAKSWDKVELDDFACVPDIAALEPIVTGVEGSNVTMICVGGGSPEPKVVWTTRNRVIANITDGGEHPTSKGRKLYISNRQRNRINLTVVNVDLHDAGVFVCTAENRGGKIEASISLIVQRRPPEALSGIRILLASVIAAGMFVIASMILVFCVCSMRKRKQIRWNKQPNRTESYEKIEMSSNSDANRGSQADAHAEGNHSYLRPYVENGISVVGKKNGNYRTVPSEDDGTGYEDNLEDTLHKRSRRKPSCCRETSFQQTATKLEINDLHIPRLIDFCDPAPDSGSSSLNGGQFEPTKSNLTSPQRSSIMLYTKPTWNQHPSSATGHKRKTSHEPHRPSASADCDKEQMYPDLLDISSLSLNPLSHQRSISSTIDDSMTQSGAAFCTFPRQRSVAPRTSGNNKVASDSQSLLLQNEGGGPSSRYGSDGLDAGQSRRMSEESYYTPSHPISTSQSNCKTILTHSRKKNPSLPTSPAKEMSASFSAAATPLLDFTQLTANLPGGLDPMLSPSASTATNAYDYHAAQLERFLEEYRNLQQQLCKMKETCESIRMKEVPLDREHDGTLGQSVKCADPVLYSSATVLSNSPATLMEEVTGSPTNRKSALKSKSSNSRQPPDPPPYWLHRNAMLKRLQETTLTNPSNAKDFYPKS